VFVFLLFFFSCIHVVYLVRMFLQYTESPLCIFLKFFNNVLFLVLKSLYLNIITLLTFIRFIFRFITKIKVLEIPGTCLSFEPF
jgi:hypothetical protein